MTKSKRIAAIDHVSMTFDVPHDSIDSAALYTSGTSLPGLEFLPVG